MYATVKTKNDKDITLNISISLTSNQLSEIKRYILETYNNVFAGHTIAVLEKWETESKYTIKCTISRKDNIIYRFATE